VAQGYTFLDGVLLEHAGQGDETSLLVTETPKFRVLRFHLDSDRDEEVWAGLPGMPDGLDRDAEGRVWIGLLRERSPAVTWIHAHPWIKPLLLRVPRAWLPGPRATGILALTPDASAPLYFALHDGSRAAEISVAVPGRKRVWLPSFSSHTPGVHSLPSPWATRP
jgi:sugar lactone lactonase YvrE